MQEDWAVGDRALINAMFTDRISGLPADPDVLKVLISTPEPGGVHTTWEYLVDPEIVRDGVGRYHFYITFTVSGTWHYRVEGTGTVTRAKDGVLHVEKSHFYP